MDFLGNRTDEHDNCGGELIRDPKHDAFYCTGCGEWVEDVCGDPDCGFCKDRPSKPRRNDEKDGGEEIVEKNKQQLSLFGLVLGLTLIVLK